MSRKTYAPGTPIFRQGDPGNAAYVVQTGKIEIWVTDDDERAEAEAAAAFDDFGAAVDENDFLDRVGRFFGFFFAAVVAAPGVAFGWRHGVVRIRGRLRARRRRGL